MNLIEKIDKLRDDVVLIETGFKNAEHKLEEITKVKVEATQIKTDVEQAKTDVETMKSGVTDTSVTVGKMEKRVKTIRDEVKALGTVNEQLRDHALDAKYKTLDAKTKVEGLKKDVVSLISKAKADFKKATSKGEPGEKGLLGDKGKPGDKGGPGRPGPRGEVAGKEYRWNRLTLEAGYDLHKTSEGGVGFNGLHNVCSLYGRVTKTGTSDIIMQLPLVMYPKQTLTFPVWCFNAKGVVPIIVRADGSVRCNVANAEFSLDSIVFGTL